MSASAGSSQAPKCSRGRPKGKNRVPLTHEQRRARNADYERLRRKEHNAAMADLAEALEFDLQTSSAALLDEAVQNIKRARKKESLADIMADNNNIKAEIAKLELEILTMGSVLHSTTGNASC